jgi:PAS domain S-box-containing protein
MKRKTPISTTGRLKTGWLADANATLSSEAQFHGFLEESPDAKIIIDKTGRINFASKRIEAMFGHLPDELVGKPISVLIPERYRDLHVGHLDRFMNNPTPRMMGTGLELRARRKDGSEIQVEISLSPHLTPDGPVVVAAIRDVEIAKRFQGLLLQELHHRVKNMLMTVIGITSQSLRSAQNLEGVLAARRRGDRMRLAPWPPLTNSEVGYASQQSRQWSFIALSLAFRQWWDAF